MKKGELVSLLLHNVALEHAAIVQYLYHVFLIGDEEITGEIEKIARQEMRHMKWFAHRIAQLGGEVELKRVEGCKCGGEGDKDIHGTAGQSEGRFRAPAS